MTIIIERRVNYNKILFEIELFWLYLLRFGTIKIIISLISKITHDGYKY